MSEKSAKASKPNKKTRRLQFRPTRNSLATALAVAPMATGLPPLGLIGAAAKKRLITKESSLKKRLWVGAAATLTSGGAGLLPYIIASPRSSVKKTK